MNLASRTRVVLLLVLVAIIAAGCATRPVVPEGAAVAKPQPHAVLNAVTTDRALEDRILALDPEHVTEDDIRNTLAKGPTPRILLIHGGIWPVYLAMTSFGRFIVAMGYPEDKIRHPGDKRWSHSPYEDGAQIAGLVAWYYEHDGMHPMMIGHSQGGVETVKVLYELAGRLSSPIQVWNPYTDAAENRTSIVDPITGNEMPVIGVVASYASAVGAGSASIIMPNQWNMANRVYLIPDSVEEFTGYSIENDIFALTPIGTEDNSRYRANGKALVHNVVLPATYNHITVPVSRSMADDPGVRAWISAYAPGSPSAASPPDTPAGGVLWVADNWYKIKKHWVLEAQGLIRAKRALSGEG